MINQTTICPECGADNNIYLAGRAEEYQLLQCATCKKFFVIRAVIPAVRITPLRLVERSHEPQPPTSERRIQWGISMPEVPYKLAPLEVWVQTVAGDHKPAIIHDGLKWGDGTATGYTRWPAAALANVSTYGAAAMLSFTPERGDPARWRLAAIYGGQHDTYLWQIAEAAKTYGRPFYLRIMHEMNGTWGYPWQEAVNGNKPGEFVLAWRHIVKIFRQAGAANARFVWCPNIDRPNSSWPALASLYPGDDYVDWTGADGYNWAAVRGEPWTACVDVFRWTYDQIIKFAPNKPFMIGEFGSVEQGGSAGQSKAAWLTAALRDLPVTFPKLAALVLYNRVDGKADWRIESSEASAAAFRAGIAHPYYQSAGQSQAVAT